MLSQTEGDFCQWCYNMIFISWCWDIRFIMYFLVATLATQGFSPAVSNTLQVRNSQGTQVCLCETIKQELFWLLTSILSCVIWHIFIWYILLLKTTGEFSLTWSSKVIFQTLLHTWIETQRERKESDMQHETWTEPKLLCCRCRCQCLRE